jgi:hypothetical protein
VFKKLLMKASDKAARHEMEEALNFVRSGSDEEMALVLAATAVSRHALRLTDMVPAPFPDDVFLGLTSVDEKAAAEISMYNMQLIQLRDQAKRQEQKSWQLFATGLGIHIAGFRALARPELFPIGRKIWKELMRGADGYMDAMARISPDLSQEEARAAFPVPNMLAPAEA